MYYVIALPANLRVSLMCFDVDLCWMCEVEQNVDFRLLCIFDYSLLVVERTESSQQVFALLFSCEQSVPLDFSKTLHVTLCDIT